MLSVASIDSRRTLQPQGLRASRQLMYLLEKRKNILKGRNVPNLLKPPISEVLIVEEPNRDIRRILEERTRTKLEGRAATNLLPPPVGEIVIVEEPNQDIRRILEERSRTKLEGRTSPNLLKPTVVEIVMWKNQARISVLIRYSLQIIGPV